jgi:hypothetical protein
MRLLDLAVPPLLGRLRPPCLHKADPSLCPCFALHALLLQLQSCADSTAVTATHTSSIQHPHASKPCYLGRCVSRLLQFEDIQVWRL